MFVLTEAERIAILSGCIILLCMVVILTVCFVCPFCWFYKIITRKKFKEDAEMNIFKTYFPRAFLDEPPPPYEPSNKTPFFDLHSPLNFARRITPLNSVSTISSDSDSITGIPLPVLRNARSVTQNYSADFSTRFKDTFHDSSDTEIPASEIPDSSSYEPGNVSITLQFKRITGEDEKIFSQLRVELKEAGELPLRAYGGRCDPYFLIILHDKSISKKKKKKPCSAPIHEFRTTVVKKSQHPVYNESFFFPLEPHQLKKSVLKIAAWDQDKWANDTSLGEIYFSLKTVAPFLLQEPSRELDLNLKLEDSKTIYGQLLLGLCYLPTAERMTVAVLKASNLNVSNGNNDITDFYVQALAIYGGKVFERRKTSSRLSSASPVFNEMLMFDVPSSKLDQIILLLTIRSSKNNGTDKESTQKTKDACIGKVVIGSYSRKNSLNHWNAMKCSPRRQVIQWHELR